MSRIISLVNQKGGVGKTTCAINIGASLASYGKRVLLIDFDPQASLTAALGSKGVSPTIYEVLKGEENIRDTIINHSSYKFVPAGINLSGAEVEFSNTAGRECILKEVVESIQDQYEYIFIDCPPSLSLLTLNALVASCEIFITLQTEFLAMEGMNQLLETVELVRKRLNPSLQVTGIVANQYDSRKGLHKEVLKTIQDHFSDKLFKTPIRDVIALAEAGSFGMDIFEYKPKSNAACDYSELATEIINQEREL